MYTISEVNTLKNLFFLTLVKKQLLLFNHEQIELNQQTSQQNLRTVVGN